MKKRIIIALTSFMFIFGFGQAFEGNVFQEEVSLPAENQSNINSFEEVEEDENETEEYNKFGPGDPPNPVPIDDYLPLLFIVATISIIYINRKNNQLLKDK